MPMSERVASKPPRIQSVAYHRPLRESIQAYSELFRDPGDAADLGELKDALKPRSLDSGIVDNNRTREYAGLKRSNTDWDDLLREDGEDRDALPEIFEDKLAGDEAIPAHSGETLQWPSSTPTITPTSAQPSSPNQIDLSVWDDTGGLIHSTSTPSSPSYLAKLSSSVLGRRSPDPAGDNGTHDRLAHLDLHSSTSETSNGLSSPPLLSGYLSDGGSGRSRPNTPSSKKKRRNMLAFMTELLGSSGSSKRPEITTPHDLVHLTNVKFDPETGDFKGLPKEWQQLLYENGTVSRDGEQLPQRVIEVVSVYNERRASGIALPPDLDWSHVNTGSPSPGRSWNLSPPETPQVISSQRSRAISSPSATPESLAPPIRPPRSPGRIAKSGWPSAQELDAKNGNHLSSDDPTLKASDIKNVFGSAKPRKKTHRFSRSESFASPIILAESIYGTPPPVKEPNKLSDDDMKEFDTLWVQLNGPNRTPSPHPNASISSRIVDANVRNWSGYFNKGVQIGGGSFGDVYMGEWTDLPSHAQRPVAKVVVKSIRSFSLRMAENSNAAHKLDRELKVWFNLRHQNIVPFIGITFDFSDSNQIPSLIALWMANGSLNDYLKKYPDVDNQPMLLDLAHGLEYLHTFNPPITHGDIKAENIFVDHNGTLRLGDFGLSRMLCDETIWVTSATSASGTVRWMAPELLDGSQKTVTKSSDMYAFAMTVLEIYTRDRPFAEHRIDGAVITAVVLRDERPERPQGMETRLWNLLVSCWERTPGDRLTIEQVLSLLNPNSS